MIETERLLETATVKLDAARDHGNERGMAPDWLVEVGYIAGNGLQGLVAIIEDGTPDELRFDRLEERFTLRAPHAQRAGRRFSYIALYYRTITSFLTAMDSLTCGKSADLPSVELLNGLVCACYVATQ